MSARPIRVLIVDDSALVRQILTQGLSQDPKLEIVGAVADPYEARDAISKSKPDVLTLDVEMPRMTGVDFLKRLMPQYPLPVVMVSSLTEKGAKTTLEALDAGAVDFVTKPKASVAEGLHSLMHELRTKLKIASAANVSHWKGKGASPASATVPIKTAAPGAELMAIGASTGGTDATRKVLEGLPREVPPIVIVQHMPKSFTAMYAQRLHQYAPMIVTEGQNGEFLERGHAYIAPGGTQMEVERQGNKLRLKIYDGETVNGHRPSVEVLFQSIAKAVPGKSVAAMLTGIGKDGATGMKAMRDGGARCFAQDEQTSVVYGMPREAFEIGAAERQVSIEQMAKALAEARVS
jgi:two-component system chemotaxis response regulator CheB